MGCVPLPEAVAVVGLPGHGGLPSAQALNPRWAPHHRPVAEAFQTAKVVILRHSSGGVFDPDTGQTTYPEPETVWTGWARIQRNWQGEVTRQIGDRQVVIRGSLVCIPADTPQVRIADEVRVECYRDPDTGDPHLIGRPLWVHDVYPGSLLWERDLVVLEAPPTQR